MVQWLKCQSRVAEVVGYPGNSVVARVAFSCSIEMAHIFSGGNHSVVTGGARSQNLCVVNGIDRYPHIGVVAVLTYVGRLHVRRTFSRRVGAVVTTDAIVNDIDVIKKCR